MSRGRFTLIFLGAPGDEAREIELTYNWPDEGEPEAMAGAAISAISPIEVDDIYETCAAADGRRRDHQPPAARGPHGVRPQPRRISVELLQGGHLPRRALGVDAEYRPLVSAGPTAASPPCRAGFRSCRADGGAGGVALCVAAIEGGAVGSLPCAMLTPDQVRAQVAEVRSRGRWAAQPQFLLPRHARRRRRQRLARRCFEPYYDEFGVASGGGGGALRRPFDEAMCAVVEEVRPGLVSFHFGLPDRALLGRVQGAGARRPRQRDDRRGSALARGARRRRDHRPGLGGGRPCRPLPRRDPAESRWGCSRCFRRSPTRSRAGHRRGRDRRRARHRRGVRCSAPRRSSSAPPISIAPRA